MMTEKGTPPAAIDGAESALVAPLSSRRPGRPKWGPRAARRVRGMWRVSKRSVEEAQRKGGEEARPETSESHDPTHRPSVNRPGGGASKSLKELKSDVGFGSSGFHPTGDQ